MTGTLIREAMMPNHSEGRIVAAMPFTALRRDISEFAAKALATAEPLNESDRQFLKDVQRIERYPWKSILRLVDLCARCPEDSDAFALAERLGAVIRASRPQPRIVPVREAVESETVAQGAADVAELAVAINDRDPAALVRAEQAIYRHRQAIDRLLVSIQLRRAQLERVHA